jgi:DNA-binding NarL/FixJ family response regulator
MVAVILGLFATVGIRALALVNMPGLGGFGAAREIKQFFPDIPILFFTMHDGARFVEDAKKAGVQGFVAKEKAGQVLLEAVDALRRNEHYFPP